MIFLDTSVLIAVSQVNHIHHSPSRSLWTRCRPGQTAISAHTLAELYSVLTSMPPALRISPPSALLVLETFLKRATAVALEADEYLHTLRAVTAIGISGGAIYDALHLACARKVAPRRVYTWNVRHFQLIAPDLHARITTP